MSKLTTNSLRIPTESTKKRLPRKAVSVQLDHSEKRALRWEATRLGKSMSDVIRSKMGLGGLHDTSERVLGS